ncbi:prepilin-type N-terminal cleavage/methylation domain-containing protein [Luteolibacter algae]|uniref:Prepilin-type N-terminal cleavage/methylation domain-containing protein n=1 Tax=Luteolibacter algae TaxID=454151 RepID=A0ABW5D9Q4_9BACT
MKTQNKQSGFTLVELLVVIVIVATLAGLGFTAARRGLMAAKASSCVSNLRQCAAAVHMIAEEGLPNNGRTPPGYFPSYGGKILATGGWATYTIKTLIAETQGACRLDGNDYVWTTHPSETILQNPLSEHKLAGDVTNPLDIEDSDMRTGLGSFVYSNQLGEWMTPSKTIEAETKRVNMAMISSPEVMIMMGEANDDEDLGKVATANGPAKGAPHGNYKDGAHCVFIDGHVERIPNDELSDGGAWWLYYSINTDRAKAKK